jgi:hypothetical protein
LIFVAQEEGDGRCGHGILHRDVCGTSPQVLQQDSDGRLMLRCLVLLDDLRQVTKMKYDKYG